MTHSYTYPENFLKQIMMFAQVKNANQYDLFADRIDTHKLAIC